MASFIAFKWRPRSRAPIQGPDQYHAPPTAPPLVSLLWPATEGERCKPDIDRWPSCQTTCTYKGSLWWMAADDCSSCAFVYKSHHFPAASRLLSIQKLPSEGVQAVFTKSISNNSKTQLVWTERTGEPKKMSENWTNRFFLIYSPVNVIRHFTMLLHCELYIQQCSLLISML